LFPKLKGITMQLESFWQEMDRRISAYDLLSHPFYQAWTAGKLTREDLRAYAIQYYPHVAAFPEYLGTLAKRVADRPTRDAILMNQADELGEGSPDGRSHAELWLDFAEGMGADRTPAPAAIPEVESLVAHFRSVAGNGKVSEALAAFCAYESQVPRVAQEKARGLKEMYGAGETTCRYFTLHTTADVHHAQVWRELLEQNLDNADAACVLQSAEDAARALWHALDGIERERLSRSAVSAA
jgi:pyrroloquinoline-quinone synthase